MQAYIPGNVKEEIRSLITHSLTRPARQHVQHLPERTPDFREGAAAHLSGRHRYRVVGQGGAASVQELHPTVPGGLLRWHTLPSRDQGLHGAGRRPDQLGQGRRVLVGAPFQGRDPRPYQVQPPRTARHGQRE
jgi:hypothetical protein